jgi:hypothetical protein
MLSIKAPDPKESGLSDTNPPAGAAAGAEVATTALGATFGFAGAATADFDFCNAILCSLIPFFAGFHPGLVSG